MPEGRPYNLVLGGGQAIPGVEELVMELKPGETKEKLVKWPEDFPDETQGAAGRARRAAVPLRGQARVAQLPRRRAVHPSRAAREPRVRVRAALIQCSCECDTG